VKTSVRIRSCTKAFNVRRTGTYIALPTSPINVLSRLRYTPRARAGSVWVFTPPALPDQASHRYANAVQCAIPGYSYAGRVPPYLRLCSFPARNDRDKQVSVCVVPRLGFHSTRLDTVLKRRPSAPPSVSRIETGGAAIIVTASAFHEARSRRPPIPQAGFTDG
jgi:hypothetical protein